MEKNPFRVTNEQLEDIMKGENYGVECDEVNDTNIHAMADDLLDARELIDKQEAIIKEMREVLSSNLRDMDKIDQICAMAGVHPYTIMRSEISAILEKTKDYAE